MKVNSEYRYIFISSFAFFLIAFFCLIYFKWDTVYELKLGDNDNYMRYLQFTSWMQNGNWYLEPMPRFNPQDGVVMHWPRITDIPLVVITKLALIFTDFRNAATFAMILVPQLYLLGTAICIGYFTHRYFNPNVASIAIIFTYLCPFFDKFSAGSVDHHNLQILLFSACIAFSALTHKKYRYAMLQGISIALSLWVGLENMYVIAFLLGIISLQAITNRDHHTLYFHFITCLNATLWGAFFLLINRPFGEFFTPYYDAISIPFIAGFLATGILCFIVANIIEKKANYRWGGIFASAIICFFPVIYLYPELIHGAFYNYPQILVDYWLSRVSEAIPILKYILNLKLKNSFFVLALAPALLLPVFIKMSKTHWFYYTLMLLTLMFPLFWQLKAIYPVYIIAIPLQALACYSLRQKTQLTILKTLIIFLTAPLILLIVLNKLIPSDNIPKKMSVSSTLNAIELLNKHQIHNSLIQAPIDYGTKILTFTNNRIIAAPYHRNIKGNTVNIEVFLSQDDQATCNLLHKNNINFILISNDASSKIYQDTNLNLASQLIENEVNIDCINLIDSIDKTYLYEVK